jgi:hypothetical protein
MRMALLLAVAMCGVLSLRAEEPKPAEDAAFVGEWVHTDPKGVETIGMKFGADHVVTVSLNGKENAADAKKVLKYEVKAGKEFLELDLVSLVDNKEALRMKLIAKFKDADTVLICGSRGKDPERPSKFTEDTLEYVRKK